MQVQFMNERWVEMSTKKTQNNKNKKQTKSNDNERSAIVQELHAPRITKFIRRRYVIKNYEDLAQIDLGDMQLFSTRNNNYSFILALINVFSKELYAVAIKNKTKEEVVRGFHVVMKQAKTNFKNLQSDRGKKNKIIFNNWKNNSNFNLKGWSFLILPSKQLLIAMDVIIM